jgi:hypothetical protein
MTKSFYCSIMNNTHIIIVYVCSQKTRKTFVCITQQQQVYRIVQQLMHIIEVLCTFKYIMGIENKSYDNFFGQNSVRQSRIPNYVCTEFRHNLLLFHRS